MKPTILLLIVLTFILSNIKAAENSDINIPLRFDRYYTYEEVNIALNTLHEAYPRLTRLDMVGKSEEGREIWALTINNPQTGKSLEKPGVYVDGNIHGNEIQAGEVCLYIANYLLTKYANNPNIKALVDKNAWYIIPVVNADGRAHFFNDANTSSTNRGIRRPKDDDRDGLFDEDGHDDLDKDGNICFMRIHDPFGLYKTDPEDARLMVQIKPGEKGEWTLLGYEGIDNDGDGKFNEDSEGYVDPNRNWPYDWKPKYIQGGAGDYPLSGTGLKAVARYIEERPNIIMAWAFHNSGGMFLRTPARKDDRLNPNDIKVYDLLGKNAEKIVPGYVYKPAYELYPTNGGFDEFAFNHIGAYSFTGELHQSSKETYDKPDLQKPASTDYIQRNRERLKFNDYLTHDELYKPWEKYNHPVYGEIEIGGWVKMSSRLPHPFMLPDLVHRNAMAVLYSASQTPEVGMTVLETKKTGKNLYKIRVRLSNPKGIPTMAHRSVKNRLYPQDMLKVEGVNVVAGGKITNIYNNQVDYKIFKPEVQFLVVPKFGKVDFEFIVEGNGTAKISYSSRKAKNCATTVKL